MELTEEKWVKIVGHDMYEISNLVRIRNIKTNRINTHHVAENGYMMCHLTNPNKAQSFFRKTIHRLMAIAFIPNPENKPCVNHINGIKSDNRVENLEWCTHSENMKHAIMLGLNRPSEIKKRKSYGYRLPEKHVYEVLKKYHINKISSKALSKEYNKSRSTILRIVNGEFWNHCYEKFIKDNQGF